MLTPIFQRRHLLADRQGLIGENYIARSGDAPYRVGQRVIIRGTAVREGLVLIEKLAAGMAVDVAAGREPESAENSRGVG